MLHTPSVPKVNTCVVKNAVATFSQSLAFWGVLFLGLFLFFSVCAWGLMPFYTLFPFLPSPFVALAHPFSGLLGKKSPPSSPSKNLVHKYKGRVEGEQKMKEEVLLVWNSTTTPREGDFWAHKYM